MNTVIYAGSFRPNLFGLHDVHGNVREHCADWYGPYTDPTRDGDGLREGKFRRYKVLRGGGWNNNAIAVRSRHTRRERVGV